MAGTACTQRHSLQGVNHWDQYNQSVRAMVQREKALLRKREQLTKLFSFPSLTIFLVFHTTHLTFQNSGNLAHKPQQRFLHPKLANTSLQLL